MFKSMYGLSVKGYRVFYTLNKQKKSLTLIDDRTDHKYRKGSLFII